MDIEFLGREVAGYLARNILTKSSVVDNCESTATDKPLSANQGAVLKGIIDGMPTVYVVPFYSSSVITDALKANIVEIVNQIKADTGDFAVFMSADGRTIPAQCESTTRKTVITAVYHGSTSVQYSISVTPAGVVTTSSDGFFVTDMMGTYDTTHAPTASAVALYVADQATKTCVFKYDETGESDEGNLIVYNEFLADYALNDKYNFNFVIIGADDIHYPASAIYNEMTSMWNFSAEDPYDSICYELSCTETDISYYRRNTINRSTFVSTEDGAASQKATADWVKTAISSHNEDEQSHDDIRALISQLSSEKVDEATLNEAVDAALTEAKESGDFKGEQGDSGVYVGSDGAPVGTKVQVDPYSDEAELVIPDVLQNTGNSTEDVMSQAAVTAALEKITTLPYGGSQQWLETNGDKSQLYEIDGYVWGYIESDGWTKSSRQFLVVSNESEMTKEGGTEYLLRSGNEGTVYSYTEASGDVGISVYDSLPETANDGDIVAVGGRKYKATLTTKEVPTYTNLADPSSDEWLEGYRLNSSGVPAVSDGTTCANFIACKSGDVLRVKGIDMRSALVPGGDRIIVYDSSKALVFTGFPTNSYKDVAAISSIQDKITYENDISTYTLMELGNDTSLTYSYSYLRISFRPGNLASSDIVITLNEEITTKTVTTVSWADIGEYVTPVEASWDATNEKFDVIDELLTTADNGYVAVYSLDGYSYTYISEGGWLATSKYTKPTLSIDAEFSYTSTNAIQNKVVKEAIDVLEAKADNNTAEISALNTKIATIETGSETFTIPPFWEDAVEACVSKIKALQIGRNCVTFPFFSDNHQRNGYAGMLIAYIMKECHIPYCFYGGDSISNGYIDSEETMVSQDKAFDTMMSYIPNGRFCRAVGNHDGYWNASAETGDEYHYTKEQIYELFFREESIAQNKHFGDGGTYYYIDDIASKTRFIVMDTNKYFDEDGNAANVSIDNTQLLWMQNEALNFTESGWAVVFFGHAPITNNYHSYITNATTVQTIIDNYNNSTDENKADVVGWYAGHIHRDRIYWTDAGSNTSLDDQETKTLSFPSVTITSDHTSISYDDATKHNVAADDQSHAIDFVTINKTTRTVNLTRLGVGEDRSYTY